jgi:hypothetical protein
MIPKNRETSGMGDEIIPKSDHFWTSGRQQGLDMSLLLKTSSSGGGQNF